MWVSPPDAPRRGPLSPIELATASVMAALATVLSVVGWLLPHASVVQSLAAVPLGVVAHRHRLRAMVAAVVAAVVVSFLCAGTGPVWSICTAAVVGGLVGDLRRRRRGLPSLVVASAVAGPLLGLATDGLLAIFAASRRLTLAQIRNLVHGLTGVAARVPALAAPARDLDRWTGTALRDWWITVAVLVAGSVVVAAVVAWIVLGGVLERMAWMRAEDRLDLAPDPRPAAPLPVRLVDARYRYPGAGTDAVAGVDLAVEGPELLALIGPNGSGKSTLARLLAGRPPTGGRVERPGSAGLGQPGGTAMIAQRPESQVLGARVADDVVWGLRPGLGVDVAGLLAAVGLAGFADRDTSDLSGGELQRLAVAAALARRPRLLLSDESTAMVDAAGRQALVDLLARLPAEHGTAVVHVTHRPEEAAAADRVVAVEGGRVVPAPGPAFWSGRDQADGGDRPAARRPRVAGPVTLEVLGVAHTYAAGTPWAQVGLRSVDLEIRSGEGVLVVGGNGSGKSTLAWVMAGLLRPDTGCCLLGGRPVADQVGAVALAFQHARLQLQRPTVGADVRAASGIARDEVGAALATVGLGADLADRPVEELSGGQQRRVALAGLLARRPRVLVLDEPMAGLDPPGRRGLLDVLAGLRDRGLTLVVISHDLEGTGSVCDRTVALAGGRLVEPAEPEEPAGVAAG